MFTNGIGPFLRSALSRRSMFLKTVGYRVLSVVVTVVVAMVVLRDFSTALDVGIWANVLKTGVYYAYERAWSEIDPAAVRAILVPG